MNTNPFSQIQPANYVSRREALPLDAILQAGTKLEKNYYDAKNLLDKMQVFANNIKVSEPDVSIRDQAINKVNQVLQQIAQNGGAYEHADDIISSLARDFAGDRNLNAAMERYARERKYEDMADSWRAQGKTVLNLNPNLKNSPTINEDGSINYYHNPYAVKLDWTGKMTQTYKNLLNDLRSTMDIPGLENLDPTQPFVKALQRAGLTKEMIRAKLEDAWNAYTGGGNGVGTDEYNQQKLYLKSQGLSDEQADAVIKQQLESIGTGMRYTKTKESYLRNPEYVSSYQRALSAKKNQETLKNELDKRRMDRFEGTTTDYYLGKNYFDVNQRYKNAIQSGDKIEADDVLHYWGAFLDQYKQNNPEPYAEIEAWSQKMNKLNVPKELLPLIKANLGADLKNLTAGQGFESEADVDRFLGLEPKVEGVHGGLAHTQTRKIYNKNEYEINGRKYSFEERKRIKSEIMKGLEQKPTQAFENLNETLENGLNLTPQVYAYKNSAVMQKYNQTFRNYFDFKDYDVQVVGNDLSKKDAKSELETMMNDGLDRSKLRLAGVENGYHPRLKAFYENRTLYLRPKTVDAKSFMADYIENADPEVARDLQFNYFNQNVSIPQEGLDLGGVKIKHADGGYEASIPLKEIAHVAEQNMSREGFVKWFYDELLNKGLSRDQANMYISYIIDSDNAETEAINHNKQHQLTQAILLGNYALNENYSSPSKGRILYNINLFNSLKSN